MVKFVFITGGVLSSVGKGIITSSIGKMLQVRGHSVSTVKIDPYVKVKPHIRTPADAGKRGTIVLGTIYGDIHSVGKDVAAPVFEAAGYPTVRTLREIYQQYQATVDDDLLRYLSRLPRDRQRRLLFLLQGMEQVLNPDSKGKDADWPETAEPNGTAIAPRALTGKTLQYTRAQN